MEASSPPTKEVTTSQPKKKIFLRVVIILLFGILLGVAFDIYQKFSFSQGKETSILAQEDNAIASLQSQQQQLIREMAILQDAMPQTTTETVRVEIIYYLQLSDTAVTILKDVPMAIALLQRAQARVEATPTLSHQAEIQQALMQDITALENVALPDLQKLSETITNMKEEVMALPFKDEVKKTTAQTNQGEAAVPAQSVSLWESVLHDIGSIFKNVVQVKNADISAAPYFLFPEQKTLLREQIRVQLEQLLLAAMGHDTLLYQSKIKEIQNTIHYFFDVNQEQTAIFLQQLDGLSNEILVPALPQANHTLLLFDDMR